MMLSGFFVNLDNVLPVLWPFQWLSSLKYTFNVMLRAEFDNNDELRLPNANGDPATIDELLDMSGVDLEMSTAFICLVALYVGFMIAALLGLMFTTRRV